MGIREKKIAEHNKTFKIRDICSLCETVMNTVPPTLWENSVNHVEKIEVEYRGSDYRMDMIMKMEPLIMNVLEDDSSYEEPSEEPSVELRLRLKKNFPSFIESNFHHRE
ncbi:uncharacterized protein LOC117166859 [Belonocnema kinseyi]|uniref:uncharacterized protein LOC117166859 n=1 Tax=Belonocnema kinseyi TaxID=2817044 RepID=UPI00143CCDB6|nr:uncharacterized protein LOC117166859 [Belonocnema kinseyi]